MKCLWIDDQLADPSYAKSYDHLFQDLDLEPVKIYSTQDAFAFIETNSDFDSVILDLNMAQDESLKDQSVLDKIRSILTDKFYDENKNDIATIAGYAIYLKLIYDGFPKDNICFLSANVLAATDLDMLEELKAFLQTGPDSDEILAKLEVLREQGLAKVYSVSLPKELARRGPVGFISYLHNLIDAEKGKKQADMGVNAKGEAGQEAYNRTAVQKYQMFMSHLESAGLQRPAECNKNAPYKFNRWKERIRDNPYYQLRAGLITGCNSLLERLQEDTGDIIRFVEYLRSKRREETLNQQQEESRLEEDAVYRDKQLYINLLNQLRSSLPVREPYQQRKVIVYIQLLNLLAHHWERVDSRYAPRSRLCWDVQNNVFECIMKLLRNWLAHNKLAEISPKAVSANAEQLLEKDVAYLSMIALRAYFRRPVSVQADEAILSRLFPRKLPAEKFAAQALSGDAPSRLEELLRQSYQEVCDRDIQNTQAPFSNIQWRLNNIGWLEGAGHCSFRDLYLMFWHGMFFSREKDGAINCYIDFPRQDTFLYNLYLLTFQEVFEKIK